MINLVGSDIDRIKINYEQFKLWFPKFTTYQDRISTYESLLEKFNNQGYKESYKLLDIEFKEFLYCMNGLAVVIIIPVFMSCENRKSI